MWLPVSLTLLILPYAECRFSCIKTKLEQGKWQTDLFRMDTTIIENQPVSLQEGQVYVYENDFPNRTIKYVHVDNVAIKTCGASAMIKSGGIGSSSVWIVLYAEQYNEIRSVIDIWGTKAYEPTKVIRKNLLTSQERRDMASLKSIYLHEGFRTVNHNSKFMTKR